MTWMEYIDDISGEWRATLVDGTIDKKKVTEELLRLAPERIDSSPSIPNMIDLVCRARSGFRRDHIKQKEWSDVYCDIFVFGPADTKQKKAGKVIQTLNPIEDNPPDGIIYLLQTENLHPFYKELLECSIEAIGLKSRTKDEYENYGSFRRRFRKLAEKLVEPYFAPCCIVRERIENCGYECDNT